MWFKFINHRGLPKRDLCKNKKQKKKCGEGGFCVLALLQFADSLRKEWNVLHSQNTDHKRSHSRTSFFTQCFTDKVGHR